MQNYIGKVIDNNDTEKTGRVQIYIEHLHHGFQPSQYPWIRQDRAWTADIPEVGDLVWVRFEDEIFHRQGYYGNKVTLKEYHKFNETIGSMTGAYPDVKYIQLANGCSIGMNSDSPEITIYHPSAEIFIDTTGQITIKASSGENKIVMDITGITLYTSDPMMTSWKPNTFPMCPIIGTPHCTITKLKGALGVPE